CVFLFFFSSRRRHTRSKRDWSSDVCSSDLSASSSNAMIAMAVAMLGVFVPLLPAIGVGIWGAVVGSLTLTLLAGALALVGGTVKIGRASCREGGRESGGAGAVEGETLGLGG